MSLQRTFRLQFQTNALGLTKSVSRGQSRREPTGWIPDSPNSLFPKLQVRMSCFKFSPIVSIRRKVSVGEHTLLGCPMIPSTFFRHPANPQIGRLRSKQHMDDWMSSGLISIVLSSCCFIAAPRSCSFWSGICHRIRVGQVQKRFWSQLNNSKTVRDS